MHLLDLHQDVMEFPAMDFSCTISMPSIDFASIVRTLLQFEEPTVISFSEQQKGKNIFEFFLCSYILLFLRFSSCSNVYRNVEWK